MPGKEELFSKLLFLIQSPAQRLATVINATGRDLAVVINQGVEKGKFAGSLLLLRSSLPVAKLLLPLPKLLLRQRSARRRSAAHVEESQAHARASGAAQPENGTASQAGEAATTDPVEG
jgi:large subunit ribosomal protein L10